MVDVSQESPGHRRYGGCGERSGEWPSPHQTKKEVTTMEYAKPELVIVGTATALVLGGLFGYDDNPNPFMERIPEGIPLDLDD
jgi:hypothetical protein